MMDNVKGKSAPKHYQRKVENAMTTHLSVEDRLLHLAEEACELGHAALKLARVRKGTNPADVNLKQAGENLIEEYADVLYCVESLGIQPPDNWYIKRQFRAEARFEAHENSKFPARGIKREWAPKYPKSKKA